MLYINGLPGMILGLSIPRLYTSFMATKIDLKISDTAAIKPTIAKKTYDLMGLKLLLKKKKKTGIHYGKTRKRIKDKTCFFWNAFL
jgi:hypothetical protein